MQRRDLNAPDAYHPVAAYTQAIEVSGAARTLYISRQMERENGPTRITACVRGAEPALLRGNRSATEAKRMT